MAQTCRTCNHSRRLEIDRALVQGRSKASIAREFGVSTSSLAHHEREHLSRQLVQAWDKKALAESTDLLATIDRILGRAEKIFERNYDRATLAGDEVALKALREQRGTIELLAKISYALHQAKVAELEAQRAQEPEPEYDGRLAVLTDAELELLEELGQKIRDQHDRPVQLEQFIPPGRCTTPEHHVCLCGKPRRPARPEATKMRRTKLPKAKKQEPAESDEAEAEEPEAEEEPPHKVRPIEPTSLEADDGRTRVRRRRRRLERRVARRSVEPEGPTDGPRGSHGGWWIPQGDDK